MIEVMLAFLFGYLFVVWAVGVFLRCLKQEKDEPIDVDPEMGAADVALALSLAIFAVVIVIGCIIAAAYSMGYFS